MKNARLEHKQSINPNSQPGLSDQQVQNKPRILSSISDFKAFFKEFDLRYDDKQSRDENILANIHRLPTNTDYLVIVEGINFVVNDNVSYQLPDNYRVRNCTLDGQGELKFIGEKSESTQAVVIQYHDQFAVSLGLYYPGKLATLLGLYYPGKNVLWNIDQAKRIGNFPTHHEVVIKSMKLEIGKNVKRIAPENLIFDECNIYGRGTLQFSRGKVTACDEITAHACGPNAQAHTNCSRVLASKEASVYATGTGTSLALTDNSSAYADGKRAEAYGMKNGCKLDVKNGATAFKNVEGVKATRDQRSFICWTLSHELATYSTSERRRYAEEHPRRFYKQLVELNQLALYDANSAFTLAKLGDYTWGSPDDRVEGNAVDMFRQAYALGHPEAAYQLGELELAKGESGYKAALQCYTKARETTKEADVHKKISMLSLAVGGVDNIAVDVNEKLTIDKSGFVVMSDMTATTKIAENAFLLGMADESELKTVFKTLDNPKRHFLEKASQLGHPEAEYQLGEYFNRPNASFIERSAALKHYKNARGVSTQTDIEKKIQEIDNNNCIIS